MEPNAKFLNYQEIEKTFLEFVGECNGLLDNAGASSLLQDDLDLDSVDIAECISRLEEETGVLYDISDFVKLKFHKITVADVCQYFHQRITNELGKAEQ